MLPGAINCWIKGGSVAAERLSTSTKIQGYFLGRFHQTPNVQVHDGHDDTFGEQSPIRRFPQRDLGHQFALDFVKDGCSLHLADKKTTAQLCQGAVRAFPLQCSLAFCMPRNMPAGQSSLTLHGDATKKLPERIDITWPLCDGHRKQTPLVDESLFTTVISRLHVGHAGACLLRPPLCCRKFFALSVVAICSMSSLSFVVMQNVWSQSFAMLHKWMCKGLCGCFEWAKVPCFYVAERSIWDQFYMIWGQKAKAWWDQFYVIVPCWLLKFRAKPVVLMAVGEHSSTHTHGSSMHFQQTPSFQHGNTTKFDSKFSICR